MKRHLRILSLLVCLALLISSAPLSLLVPKAYASEQTGDEQNQTIEIPDTLVTDEPVSDIELDSGYEENDEMSTKSDIASEEQDDQIASDSESTGAIGDEDQSAADDGTAPSDEAIPAQNVETNLTPEPITVIDYAADASMSPDFKLGYAEVLSDDTPAYDRQDVDAQVLVRLGRGVVYAFYRTTDDSEDALPDRLHVAFNLGIETGIVEAWVDAQLLRPLEPGDEVDAYRQFCAELDELAFYHDDAGLPLARMAYILPKSEPDSNVQSLVPTATPYSVLESAASEDENQAEPEATHPIIMPAVTSEGDETFGETRGETPEALIPSAAEPNPTPIVTVEPTATPESQAPTGDENDDADGGADLLQGSFTIPMPLSEAILELPDTTPNIANNNELSLTPQSLTLGVDMSNVLSMPGAPEDLHFTCDSEILELTENDDGTVTVQAITPGIAMICASSSEECVNATATVTVLPAPTSQQLAFSADSTRRLSPGMRSANISADFADGTMAQLAYRIVGNTPKGVTLNEDTGALTAARDAPTSGTMIVEAYDVNHPDVGITREVLFVPGPGISGLKQNTIQLGVGEQFQISDGPDGIIQLDGVDDYTAMSYTFTAYSDSNLKKQGSAVAEVDATTGVITGKKAGKAYIKIVSGNGGTAQKLTVEVYAPPANAMMTPAIFTLGVGMTEILSTNYKSGCCFTSSNEGVASVDSAGTVTAVAAGEAVIRLTTWNGMTDTSVVHVCNAPETVAMSPADKITIGMGQKGVHVSAKPGEAGTMASFTYASDNPDVVNVNDITGELTPVAPGVTDVTATVDGSDPAIIGRMTVTVKAGPTRLMPHTSSIQLGVGDSYQLTEYDAETNAGDIEALGTLSEDVFASYSYYASAKSNKNVKSNVIEVNANGLITAKKAGTAYVRIAEQTQKYIVAIKVVVSKAAGSISISVPELILGTGMTGELSVKFPSKTYSRYSIESSDTDIASIALNGKADQFTVTALAIGEATVTVRTDSGKLDSCHVRVLPGTENINWTFVPPVGGSEHMNADGAYILGVGERKAALTAVADEDTLADFSFSSDMPDVLTVDEVTGELTPKSPGRAHVTIKAGDGEESPCVAIPFVVLDMPANGALNLTQNQLRLGVGDTYQLSEYPDGIINLGGEYRASYTYKSSNAAVATVNANGLITAKKIGSAKIRISTQNAKVYKDLSVSVKKYSSNMNIAPELSLGTGMTATIRPVFASGAFSAVDYEVSKPDLIAISVDIDTGACTLTAPEPGSLEAPVTVTITARQRKTRLTDSCVVALMPEPQVDGIKFDFEAMRNVETDGDGVRYLSVGRGEKDVQVVACCTDPATFCDFEYKVDPDNSGLSVSTDGILNATDNDDRYYTVTALAKNNPAAHAELKVKVVPAPTSVDFSISRLLMGVGDSFQLVDSRDDGIIVLSPADAKASFTFSASKYRNKVAATNILSISRDGTITARKTGTAYIKVTTQNDCSKVLEVKIYNKAKAVSLNPEMLQIGELSEGTLTLSYPKDSYSILSDDAYSSDPELLSINQNGLGRSTKLSFSTGILPNGEARDVVISAKTQSGVETKATVRVLPHPTELSFAQDNYELSSDMTLETRLIFPQGTMAQNLRYESEDENIAAIDTNGVITGTNPTAEAKSTTITVTANPDTDFAVSATSTVTVYSAPASLAFEGLPEVVMLPKGDILPIPEPVARSANGEVIPSSFTYATSSSAYVAVNGNMMKAVKTGKTVYIKASTSNGIEALFPVRVYDSKPTNLNLYCEGAAVNDGTLNMYINKQHPTDNLALSWEITGKNVNRAHVSFESSESDVATVDELGVITAHGMGTAVIKAKSRTGSANAQFTVVVGELCMDPKVDASDELVLDEGESEILQITCQPEGSGMRFKYTSDDESIASVDSEGNITTHHGGSANITVTGQYGWQRQVHVKALYYPDSVSLNVNKLSMAAPIPSPDSDRYEGAPLFRYDSVILQPVLGRTGVSQLEQIDLQTEAKSENNDVVEVLLERAATETEPASYKLIAKAEGSTTIIISTKRSEIFTSCEVVVGNPTQPQESNGFGWTVPDGKRLVLMRGDETPAEFNLSSEVYSGNNFRIGIDSEDILSYDEKSMTLHGSEVGKATLTLLVDEQAVDTAEIEVISPEKPRLLYGKTDELTEELPAKANMDVSSFTADFAHHQIRLVPLSSMDDAVLLGTVKLDIGDPNVLKYDKETGRLNTTETAGTTQVTFTTYGGSVSAEVSVLPAPVYRALLISEYNNSGNSGDLPFSQGNIDKMWAALNQSDIAGQRYKINVLNPNPTEAQIRDAILTTFTGAKANDVSLIYIVSHGNVNSKYGKSQYYFSLSPGGKKWSWATPTSYVTDTELMNWIQASPAMTGKVVLVIDSCSSGGFITYQAGKLTNMDNLAVITAQVTGKSASYYVGPYKGIQTFEFFTRAFTTSLGYPVDVGDEWNNAGNGDSNADGWVSVSEAFTLADGLTRAMVQKYCPAYYVEKQSVGFKSPAITNKKQAAAWLSTDSGQDPQTFIPEEMKDLVIMGN